MTDGVTLPFIQLTEEQREDFLVVLRLHKRIMGHYGPELGRQMLLNALVAAGDSQTPVTGALWLDALEEYADRDAIALCQGEDGRILGIEIDYNKLMAQ